MASNNQQQLKVENLKHEEFKKFHEAVFEKTLRVRIFGARCQVVAKEKKDDEKTELLGKNLDD